MTSAASSTSPPTIPSSAHKCNAGLANRHVASLSRTASGKVLAAMGTIGPSGNGAQLFDPVAHRWGTQINGSRFIAVHSQNSNPTDGGWPRWGIGHRYVRSTGELRGPRRGHRRPHRRGVRLLDLCHRRHRRGYRKASRARCTGTEQLAVRYLIQHDTGKGTVFVRGHLAGRHVQQPPRPVARGYVDDDGDPPARQGRGGGGPAGRQHRGHHQDRGHLALEDGGKQLERHQRQPAQGHVVAVRERAEERHHPRSAGASP